MNNGFDEELRKALRRVDAPHGFAERVMARVPDATARIPFWSGRNRYWVGALAAGVTVLALFGGIERSRHDQRLHAEQTQRQVVFALSLASEKLDIAMQRANVRLQRSAPDVTIGGDERGQL